MAVTTPDLKAILATSLALAGTTSIDKVVGKGKNIGVVKVRRDKYVPVGDASETAAKTILIGEILDGASILGVIVSSGAQGNSCTLAVGDCSDGGSARYAAATSVASAVSFFAAKGTGYLVGTAAGDGKIILTIGTNALAADATKVIETAILYMD